MDNDRYMQALRQRSAVMPYGMPVSSDPEASDAYGEGVVRGVAKNLRARAGDFINALRSPMETLGGIVETGKQIVRDPMGSVRAMARAEALRAANTASGPEAAGEYAASFLDPLRYLPSIGRNRSAMSGQEDFMRRRESQLAKEEADDAKNLADMTDRGLHQANIDKLLGKKDWMSQTEKRAAVVSRLHDELPFVKLDPTPSVRDFNAIVRQFERFKDPDAASNALSYIAHFQKRIDADFDEYIAGVREYRKTLNPRSSRDREKIKRIDEMLGDSRVTRLQSSRED